MSGPDTRDDLERGGNNDRDPITRLARTIVETFRDADEQAVQVHLDERHPAMPALLDQLYGYGVFGGSEAILSEPMLFHYNKASDQPSHHDFRFSLITPTLPPTPAGVSVVVSAGDQPAICFRLVSKQNIEPSSSLIFIQTLGVSMLEGLGPIVFRSIECKRVYGAGDRSVAELIVEGNFREVTTPEKAAVICDLAKSSIQRMLVI
jgi:hypothetical protein